MTVRERLLFGPLAAALFLFGIGLLGATLPGYDQVRQTVSEIGEVGSRARIPFSILLCATGACLLVFAWGLREVSVKAGHSALSAAFTAAMAVCAAGVGIFSYPHPLHNVFGMAELVGYQAPAVLAFTWRRDMRTRIATFSWCMYAFILLAIAANLSVLSPHGELWRFERPIYGIVQRSLFVAWFMWSAGVGVLLVLWIVRVNKLTE